jgi:enterochelin esterase-like enzyme
MITVLAHGWGLLSLGLIAGGITLGIYALHPFIFGLVGVVSGIVFWGIGVYKPQLGSFQATQEAAKKKNFLGAMREMELKTLKNI